MIGKWLYRRGDPKGRMKRIQDLLVKAARAGKRCSQISLCLQKDIHLKPDDASADRHLGLAHELALDCMRQGSELSALHFEARQKSKAVETALPTVFDVHLDWRTRTALSTCEQCWLHQRHGQGCGAAHIIEHGISQDIWDGQVAELEGGAA